MPRKGFALATAGLLAVLLATAVLAADVWKEKPFEQWDQKDVQKILNDSPWAKRLEFAPMADLGGPDMGTAAGQEGGSSVADKSGRRGGGAPGGPSGGGPRVFIARWYSSRTVREAFVRDAELHGTAQAEATKPLAETPENYQIVLVGQDLSAFARAGEEALQKSSYLELKKTKEKVAPVKVTLAHSEDDKRILAVVCEFPKKSAGGGPTIGADEKDVDFVTQAGKSSLKFHFDITKMDDKQGLDL